MSRLQDESSVLGVASTSQESPSLMESEKLRVTLLGSEWSSSKGGLSTINRELAIQLAKHPNVDVSVYLPSCSDEDRRAASSHKVQLIEAQESPGFDQPIDWLVSLPNDHYPHCVIGHGVHLGRQIPHIQKQQPCKWIQVVHTAPEELGMFKSYEEAISRGEKKHRAEVRLCELADEVVAIGPKLANAYSRYLRFCKKDQHVFNLTPSIFTEFSNIEQASEERENFCVLVFGRGDHEDFELKGYDIAMEAIAQLKDESYQLKFVGAPEGKEKEVVSKLLHYGIPRSQLTVRCFKEDREQLGNLFCEADLAIMPSRTEGFGLTGLEALSAGLPVLVSGNSGLGQALEKVPGGSSCVIHSEDPKKWASAIRVICQKKRMVRLEEATLLREEYAAKYSWQRQCESLVEKMVNLVSVDPVTWQPLAASEENESSTTVAVQQEDAVEKKSRQASNEKVKRSSSSVTTQSVKRLKDAEVNKSRQASSKELKRSSSSVATQSVKRPKDAVVNKSRQASSKEVKRSSSSVASKSVKHLKGAVVKKSRQVSNEKVKRRSSSVATQSVKRRKGSDHCLVVEHLEGEYIRRSNVNSLLWDSDIQLPIDEVYTRLQMKWRKKAYFQLTEKEVHMYEIFKPAREGDGLANSRSLTRFSLAVNNHAEDIIGDWASGVDDGLANSRSLTTFSLTINNHVEDIGLWASRVGDGLANSRSLTTFSLTVNNHAEDIIGDWASGVGDGLANSRSLTTFILTVNNHVEDFGLWASRVGDGLAKSRSLTTFSLTVNNHAEDMGLWASGVGDGLANSRSLTTFSLTVNNHAGEIGRWTNDLSKGLVESGSLTTIRVAFNLYGEDRIR